MALSPQRKLHSGLSGQIKLAIYGLLSLALTHSLDVALKRWVPCQEAAIISAGVMEGRVPEALRRAMTVVQGIDEMKSSVLSTLGYPMALIGTVVGIMVLVSQHFIPQLAKMVPRETWQGGIWWLGTTADFVVDHGILLSLMLMLATAWISWSFSHLTGRCRRGLDWLIPWSVYKDFQGVAFLLNMAALLRAGVKTLDALDILARCNGLMFPATFEEL